ncbi:MAG: hypothetical protein QME32_00265 [Endomicrobiia bacterium]|nr:hypothetical protein [Endomicrobiia bacterium]
MIMIRILFSDGWWRFCFGIEKNKYAELIYHVARIKEGAGYSAQNRMNEIRQSYPIRKIKLLLYLKDKKAEEELVHLWLKRHGDKFIEKGWPVEAKWWPANFYKNKSQKEKEFYLKPILESIKRQVKKKERMPRKNNS